MSDFGLWFETGLQHIADWKGYDHILFVAALCGVFQWAQWRQLLVLITAFTIGHSLTLALSTLHWIKPNTALIEALIPLTILLTCIGNLWHLGHSRLRPRYWTALVFGLVHGMGFSFLLQSMLGSEENITWPLLAFNLGLEAGQLLIVMGVLLLSTAAVKWFKVPVHDKDFFLSSAIFGVALVMLLERIF